MARQWGRKERNWRYSRSDKERLNQERGTGIAARRDQVRKHHTLAYLPTARETELDIPRHALVEWRLDTRRGFEEFGVVDESEDRM